MDENIYTYDDSNRNSRDDDSSRRQQPQYRRIEGFFEDDIREFVGNNADKYIERFYCIARGQKPYNWCSALFTSGWMIYRKMWKQAVVFSVIISLISSAASIFGRTISSLISLVMLIFYFAVIGREGNVLYWNYVKEELTKEGLANLPEPDYEKREQLPGKGGTSILFLILLFIFNSALTTLLGYIF